MSPLRLTGRPAGSTRRRCRGSKTLRPMVAKKTRRTTGTAVAELAPSDPREFRKTNDAIGLREREGRLSLLTRKIFNVMMYHAQELRAPGRNAPIDTASAKKYFWIPLSDLARDAAYDSRDTEFLKQQIEELQNIKLLIENERQWTSERLVASVTLVNPLGFKKHAGQVWLGYAFPPEVHELVMAPGTYTRLSIFYQGLLRSGSALALYEVCRRYATNPSKMTLVDHYGHWYAMLTGNPVPVDGLPPYKYFKRDVIKPAIAEINTLTDIQIELVEHKNGRRVERLQFRVEKARQPQLDFPASPVIDLKLLGCIMKFGFSQQEATDLVAQHADDKVRVAVAFVEARLGQRNSSPVDSPAAYFRWALKEGRLPAQEAVPSNAETKTVSQKRGGGPTFMDKFLAHRAQEALALYRELDADDQGKVFERFRQSGPPRKVLSLGRGIENAMVRSLFSQWYAKDLWGEPTVEGLADFAEQAGVGAT